MNNYKGSRSMKDIMSNIPPETIQWKRKRMNNTVEYALKDGTRKIRLHDTDIITYLPNCDIMLDSGGWQTVTTKSRFNEFLICGQIYQEKSIWYLHLDSETYVYQDGMTINQDTRKVKGAGKKENLQKLNKDIKKYVNGYCEELFSGSLPAPSGGDCWFCSLREVNTHRPMGEIFRDSDHILEHFKEKYYVPSLVVNAIEDCGVSIAARHHLGYLFQMHDQRSEWCEGIVSDQIRKALTRYLRRQLGLAK